jgi:hypothetical protein
MAAAKPAQAQPEKAPASTLSPDFVPTAVIPEAASLAEPFNPAPEPAGDIPGRPTT